MSIIPNCHLCGEPLEDYGALAFSPPDHYEDCHKYHICRECWPEVQKALDGNGWIPVGEMIPLDEFSDAEHVVTDVLVCGAWDEDEPPPNTSTCLVGYCAEHGWTFAHHYGKPWPFADKITHWMPLPEPHPNSGDVKVPPSSRWGTLGYARRATALMARDLSAFAEKISPEGTPPCLVELRAAIEHMAFELEHRHATFERADDAGNERENTIQ